MKTKFPVMALIACTLLASCSKDSTTILQGENTKLQLNKKMRNGEALLDSSSVNGQFSSLIQLGKKPDAGSVAYYTIKEEILSDQSKRLIVSALELNISDKSEQDFFKRVHNVSEIIIVADKVTISTLFKVPGTRLFINAQELAFEKNGLIDTTPEVNFLLPPFGQNGAAGKRAGDLFLNVKKMNLNGQKRFVLNGGKGGSAGLGKAGADGKSVNVLYENVIKECTTTFIYCMDPEAGEIGNTTKTCRGSDQIPTNGIDALNAGMPGDGGDGGRLFVSENFNVNEAFIAQAGLPGEAAPEVSGGKAGSPSVAILRNIDIRRSTGSCRKGGGGKPGPRSETRIVKDQVVATTSPGKSHTSRTIIQTAKNGEVRSLADSETLNMVNLRNSGNINRIRLTYAKDLYRNNYFSEARVELNKLAAERCYTTLESELLQGEVNLYLNQLNTNKDFYGYDLNLAPIISLEASMLIYKRNVRTSVNTISLAATIKKRISTVKDKKDEFLIGKNQVRSQMEVARNNHDLAYAMIPVLENKKIEIEYAQSALKESLQKVEAQIIAEAKRNIQSAEKKKKLIGGLKLIAGLATVSPLGQPASGAIGASLSAALDLSQNKEASWQDVLGQGMETYSGLREVNWKASKENWNSVYATLDADIFRSDKLNKKEAEKYLRNLYQVSKPLITEVNKYYTETYSRRVPNSQYEAEVERIKSIHPMFKELTTKLEELQQKKADYEVMLSQLNNTIISTESEIIKDFAMITSIESDEERFSEGLDFSLEEALEKLNVDAQNRLMKYKGALIKAYTYRTLTPYPGSYDVEELKKQIELFSKKSDAVLTADDLIKIYDEDMAAVGKTLYESIQEGFFKEYESEFMLDLNSKEIAALMIGKKVYLNLAKESELFDQKANVRILSIEMPQLNVEAYRSRHPELVVEHLGESVLTKGGKDYLFKHNKEAPATWITRLDMINGSGVLVNEASSNGGLLMSIMGREMSEGTLLFNRVGAKSVFSLQLRNAQDAIIHEATLKINYSYSLK